MTEHPAPQSVRWHTLPDGRRVFDSIPPVGSTAYLYDQPYTVIGDLPHIRRDGVLSRVLVWRSHCPTCGQAFECKSGPRQMPGQRRCDLHKQAGTPVPRHYSPPTATQAKPPRYRHSGPSAAELDAIARLLGVDTERPRRFRA